MSTLAKNRFSLTALISALLLVGTYTSSLAANTISKSNGSIVYTGEHSGPPDLKTTNGRIEVGNGLTVGTVKTTNGTISLGEKVVAEEIKTTNGAIHIDSGSQVGEVRTTNGGIKIVNTVVNGDVRTTNGALTVSERSQIVGSVITTNGGIYLDQVNVGENVQFTNGKMVLDESEIVGDIIVNEGGSNGWFNWGNNKKPIVIVGRDTTVKGKIIAKRDIELYVHESAKVGEIEGAEAEVFSGDRP